MAIKRRVRLARGSYEVGYGRPPVASRFQKGQSGNPGGRPRAVAPQKYPKLENQILDAILTVMGELVLHEVSPGCTRWVARSEALVREFCDRAAYDHRAFKQLTELVARASWQAEQAREQSAREEEARLQLLREKEKMGQYLADLKEERRELARLERNRKRRARQALKKAQAQAQADGGVACEFGPPAAEVRLDARAEEPASEWEDEFLGADQQPVGGGWEDERLGDRGVSPARAVRTKVAAQLDEASAQLSWSDVRRPAVTVDREEARKVRRRGEPLIADTRPLIWSGYL